MLKKINIIFIMLLIWINNAYSDPRIESVYGSTISGSKISITGSGFGLKSVFEPIKWDNFESGANGDTISGWDVTYGNNVKYSNVGNRTGSSLCYAAGVTTADNPSNAYASNSRITLNKGLSFTKIFASYWIKWSWGNIKGGQIKHGIHVCREYPTGTSAPRFNGVVHYINNNVYWQGTGYVKGGGTVDSNTTWGVENMYPANTWVQVEVQAELSNVGALDGSLISWVGKASRAMEKVVNYPGNICLRTEESDYNWAQIDIWTWAGNDVGDGYSTTIYYDDVYVDTTWARVVIGDAPTYDNCTRREVQIPTAWSNNSIAVTFNQGAYAVGQPVYLYVVDANGNHSNGYLLKIGVKGDINPPSQPTGVTTTVIQ